MRKPPSARKRENPRPAVTRSRTVTTVLRRAAGVAAIVSIILAARQIVASTVADRERRAHVAELLSIGNSQQAGRDFASAWASFAEAGHLEPDNRAVRAAQEQLAMAWLEGVRLDEGQTYSQIVDTLRPVLYRGLVRATGVRQADLLAHLGWADFLRSRDGIGGLVPDSNYRRALAVDSTNVYAHAMWGHWILWEGGGIDSATRHFSAALATGRAHAFVRRLQLAALTGAHTDAADAALIRAANEMRVASERVEGRDRSAIWFTYYSSIRHGDRTRRLLAVEPAADQLATFRWLFDGEAWLDDQLLERDYWEATLQEAAGQGDDALRAFLQLRAKLPPGHESEVDGPTRAAVERLAVHH